MTNPYRLNVAGGFRPVDMGGARPVLTSPLVSWLTPLIPQPWHPPMRLPDVSSGYLHPTQPSLTELPIRNELEEACRITPERLLAMGRVSQASANEYAGYLEAARPTGELFTPQRVAQWVAQMYVECGAFSHLTEYLAYITTPAEDVVDMFSAFDSLKEEDRVPKFHELQSKKDGYKAFANFIYNEKNGNKKDTDDGFNFRGRGFMQLTGRDNYKAAGDALNLPLVDHPEQAADPRNAALIAADFWRSNGLNVLADAGNTDAITYRINKAGKHKEERRAAAKKARGIWRD